MTFKGCPREKEVRDLVERGQWLVAADVAPELCAHVDGCRACSDFVLVSEAFRLARAESTATVRLVPPGVLWWRAQLRRRNAAMERLTRPLLGAQIFALIVTVLAGAGFFGFVARPSGGWLAWFQQLPQSTAMHWDNFRVLIVTNPLWTLMMLGPALVLLGSVAVYIATERQ
jgi:hypothetical protein